MAETPDELRTYVQGVYDSVLVEPSDWDIQNAESFSRSVHVKYDHQLTALLAQYKRKIPEVIASYEETLDELSSYLTNFNISGIQLRGDLGSRNSKVKRLVDKWLAVQREVEGRTKGYFTRNPVGTDYYIDPTNGSNTSPHDGLRHPTTSTYSMDSGSGTTTLVETSQLPRTTTGDWNGAYLYNVTRSTGVIITTSTYSAGTWTLTHPTITGQTSGDTYFIIDAWATLAQYTTTTARSAGDRAYVRANDTETLSVAITHDEDGTPGNPIEVIGCDATTNDPWNDSSSVKPILDFNGGAYGVGFGATLGWKWTRMVVHDSHNSTGMIGGTGGGFGFWKFVDCDFEEFGGNWNNMVNLSNSQGSCEFDGCTWDEVGANNTALGVGNGYAICKNCTLDAGSVTQGRMAVSVVCGTGILIDCVIGGTTSFYYRDVQFGSYMGRIYARNTDFDIDPISSHFGFSDYSIIKMEDSEQVLGAGKIVAPSGTVETDTTIKTGNADFSHKMTPDTDCDTVHFLELSGNMYEIEAPFVVWGTASQEITLTVKLKELGSWATYPTASELYLEASYYDSGSDLGRSKAVSTDVLSDVSTTVDADSSSGQKVLNVAATTGFAVGDEILIHAGGAREERGVVASISAGASLTLEENLTYTHTAVQADDVAKEWFEFSVTCTPLRNGPIYLNAYLGVYEDAGDGCYVNGEAVDS